MPPPAPAQRVEVEERQQDLDRAPAIVEISPAGRGWLGWDVPQSLEVSGRERACRS